MSALDEARKEKVMNAMEHTKAFIAAVAEFDADRVRAAAEVRPRPPSIVANPRRLFLPRRLLPIPPAPVSCPDAERVTLT